MTSSPETRCKSELYESLQGNPTIRGCDMDRHVGTLRPPVSFYLRGFPVAVELQAHALPLYEIAQRTTAYYRMGIAVLWLNLHLERARRPSLFIPEPWEEWLHAFGYGRVAYWVTGELLDLIHYERQERTREWDGVLRVRYLKSRKVVSKGNVKVSEMYPARRKALKDAPFVVPDAYLLRESPSKLALPTPSKSVLGMPFGRKEDRREIEEWAMALSDADLRMGGS